MRSTLELYSQKERDWLLRFVSQDPQGAKVLRRAQQALYDEQDESMDRAQATALREQAQHLSNARKIMLPYVGAPLETVPQTVMQEYLKELDQARVMGNNYLRLARREKQMQRKRTARAAREEETT